MAKTYKDSYWNKLKEDIQTRYKKPEPIQLKPCHDGTVKAFDSDNITFYGGGTSRGLKIWNGAVILSLTGNLEPTFTFMSAEFESLKRYDYRGIGIDWVDFDIPELTRDFWLDLYSLLKDIADKDGHLDVIVYCLGGHGRTGTALSILAGVSGVTKSDPVEYIRNRYCKNAVETVSQEKYVEDMTGLKVDSAGFYKGKHSDSYSFYDYCKVNNIGNELTAAEKQEEKDYSDYCVDFWSGTCEGECKGNYHYCKHHF